MDLNFSKFSTKSTRIGSSSVNQNQQFEQIKSQCNSVQALRNNSKKIQSSQLVLKKAILMLLYNMKLECEGLKLDVYKEIEKLKQLMLDSFKTQINKMITLKEEYTKNFEKVIQNLNQQHQTEIAQLQEHFAIRIEQLQMEVNQSAHKLQQSEDNEIGLMYLNKRQQILNDQLRIKIKQLNEKCYPRNLENQNLKMIQSAQNFLRSTQNLTSNSYSSEKLDRSKTPMHQSLDFGFLQRTLKGHKSVMHQESKQNPQVNQKMAQTISLFNCIRSSQGNNRKS